MAVGQRFDLGAPTCQPSLIHSRAELAAPPESAPRGTRDWRALWFARAQTPAEAARRRRRVSGLLHGDLDLWILEARLLPNMDLFSEQLRRFLTACRPPTSGASSKHTRRRRHHRKIITSDPYVTLSVAGAVVARTAVIQNTEDPVWEERFAVPLAHRAAGLEFQVKDNDTFGAQVIGTVSVPAERLLSGEEVEDWFPVIGASGKPYKPDTALRLRFQFHPIGTNPAYIHGIPGDPKHEGVKDAYFPLCHGGQVTLYQDAHVREGDLPEIELDKGKLFEHNSCWEDICHAILEAHHMIYIVGWSVYDKVKLVREPSPKRPLPEGGDLTLGELLKFKSQEGVRVACSCGMTRLHMTKCSSRR
jgi:phospholipase D1/2